MTCAISHPPEVLMQWTRFPKNLLFPRLNAASPLSLSSYVRCSRPLVVFMALCWPCSVCPCLSCALPQDWTQHSKCLIYAVQCSLDMLITLLNVIQDVLGLLCCKDISGPYLTSWTPLSSGHLQPSSFPIGDSFQSVGSQPVLVHGLFLPKCRTLFLHLLNYMRFLLTHCFSLLKSLWQQHALLAYQPLPGLYGLQTYWGCTLSCHLGWWVLNIISLPVLTPGTHH